MTQLLHRLPRAGAFFVFALFVSSILAATSSAAGKDADTEKKSFDLPAGDAEATLREFTKQAKVQLVFDSEKVAGIKTAAVQGEVTPREALDQMFAGTGLVVQQDKSSGAFTIRKETPAEAKNASSRPVNDWAAGDRVEGTIKLDTFEVMGTKLLNMDVKRSRDDAQPYVVFDRAMIEQSGAVNLENLLKTRLPMNTIGQSPSQGQTVLGSVSSVNLRGLGIGQTLILIDGHRSVSPATATGPRQSDLNGIPLAAVERIEILPTTASGIYGGAATGGVINIVLRRDYAGVEVKATYQNTFDSDASLSRVDLSAGLTLEGGKTNALLALSYADSNSLLSRDRIFVRRGRTNIFANNPGFFLNATTPPLGATPNIRSSNGTSLVLKSGTPLNSAITFVPNGYLGAATDGGAALVANAGNYNLVQADTAQTSGRRAALGNAPVIESGSLTLRRQFSPVLQAFLETGASNNTGRYPISGFSGTITLPASAPTNPFVQQVTVAVPNSSADSEYTTSTYDRRIVGGVIVKLPAHWQAEADYTWNQSRSWFSILSTTAFSAAGTTAAQTGVLDILRDPAVSQPDFSPYLNPRDSSTPMRSTLRDATLRLSGPTVGLPAGPIVLSSLLEHRDEGFASFLRYFNATNTFLTPGRSQAVDSAYAELQVPVISADQHVPAARELSLQLAARGDEYRVRGASAQITLQSPTPITETSTKERSFNPTVGLKYRVSEDVMLRVSYGTGFLPPTVAQLLPADPVPNVAGGVDPRRGNTPAGPYTLLNGGEPYPTPEKSKSWSAGVVLTPRIIPGLRASLDYTKIDKTNNIATLAFQSYLDNEAYLPGIIVRGPVPAGDTFGVGPIISVNAGVVNIAKAYVEAYDLALDYDRPLGSLGTLSAFAVATWQTHYRTQLTPLAPVVENVGVTTNNPLKFKGNAGLTWQFGSWRANWTTRYFDSYIASTNAAVLLNQGNGGRVPSQTYHDLFVSYRFPNAARGSRLLNGLEITAGVKNLFNAKPPFDASSAFFYSYFGDAQLATYFLSVKRSF